ncbi:hypothetical protein PNEG_00201 [Pneumocystis murina B123]|uniref:PH domain-containing protein n=1 Tax=Pneumocystis murina (strain B123) TaxID=1069680 RepID=M7PMV2_PNEMU|nr:hypothetical protein PNEG_00201 [Pneumocystis murina B123]EMR11774.1 hypothetical protein PNEG_00201 [Pneumocystis murina B123]
MSEISVVSVKEQAGSGLNLKSEQNLSHDESELANSPLCAFFYEVNRIRQGNDRKKSRDSKNSSQSLLSSSYNLSKKDLSGIKTAAFFNRRYGGLHSTESLKENTGLYLRRNAMLSRATVDSGNTFDDCLSIKTSSDYEMYNGNNVCKVIDSPLKAPTVHNVEYREYYDKNPCVKEPEKPVNIFKDEVSEKIPEKKSFFLKGSRKSSGGKNVEKKSTLRSISLNIKNLITSIVSNSDDHTKQSQIENNGESLQKENEFSGSSVSQTENAFGANLSNEKSNITKSTFSEFYNRNLRKDIRNANENEAPKMKEDVLKCSVEDEEKNKNNDVTASAFEDLSNGYHITRKNYQTYVSNDSQEMFLDDFKYKYDSDDVPCDDRIENNIQKSKSNVEESLTYESEPGVSQRLPSFCKLDAIEIGNFGLDDFMIRKSSNISTKEINEFKSKFHEDMALSEEKINDSDTTLEKKTHVKPNDFSNTLTKAYSSFEIADSDDGKYKSDIQSLNNNKNTNIGQSTADENSGVSITLPLLGDPLLLDFDVSLNDVSDAIDRVIEVQKRGYIMRQNINIVHASSNDICEKNIKRERYESPKVDDIYEKNEKNPVLKFDKTKDLAINKVPQDNSIGKKPDSGLLFIRVIEIENLDLPLPEDKTLRFCCTLDNGQHYITTPWISFTKNAKINEEFELIANDDLEFTLTLRLDYQPLVDNKKKDFIFSRIFSTSKKKGALNLSNPLNCCLSNNGSIGRSYLSLKMFKDHAFGCLYTTTVTCMNEWTKKAVVKGKKQQVLKVKSYIICQLKINAFYVPFVPGQAKETLPKSLSACVKDIKNAEWVSKLHYEGLLIQHGGDCLYRKKRYFRLSGLKLTSYHESSKSIRSNINLAKVKMVLNDQQLSINSKKMTQVMHSENSKQSTILEGDNDYMFAQNGFCIKFFNGEIINFYADSEDEKVRWVRVLDAVIKKAGQVKPWSLYVLQKQKVMKRFPLKSVLKKN